MKSPLSLFTALLLAFGTAGAFVRAKAASIYILFMVALLAAATILAALQARKLLCEKG